MKTMKSSDRKQLHEAKSGNPSNDPLRLSEKTKQSKPSGQKVGEFGSLKIFSIP